MGQAETKDSEVDKTFEKLTDTERKCLDQIFPINPDKDSDAVFSQLKVINVDNFYLYLHRCSSKKKHTDV